MSTRRPVVLHVVDLPLADRGDALGLERLAVRLLDQPVDRLLVDGRAEALLDDARRELALPESGQARPPGDLLRDADARAADPLGRNGDGELATPGGDLLDGDSSGRLYRNPSAALQR
jgi:hypothetical protein